MNPRRIALAAAALLLIALAWWQVGTARAGLVVREMTRDGVPMLYVAPVGGHDAPGVLVAHGFAGSKQLMLGYGYTLAHAGYAALLWDFGGHGANGNALEREVLQRDLDRAYAVLLEQPEVDGKRVALLGHSMGSGAVMAAGIQQPDRYAAVVAVSPTAANVSPTAPRNLLLQGGGWEGQFVGNAVKLLAAAGGPNEDFAGGRARRLVVIPNAEHISILFRNESHQAALDWLNATFGQQRASAYVDRRILWYLLHLAAWMLLAVVIAPWVRSRSVGRFAKSPYKRPWLVWIGLALGPLVAAGVLAGLNRVTPLATFGGIQVGGAVGLWLLIAGGVWLGVTWIGNRTRPELRPAKTGNAAWTGALTLGLGLFALLSVAFGVMAQGVWVQWWLIPPRLLRWPLLALASLPWFLAAGQATQGCRAIWRVAWWLGQSAGLVGGLFLALALVPSLGFLVLLMPLLPVILGILAVVAAAFDRPWVYGIGGALFFGWIIAAVFPLAG
ncbi:MAG: alpha/beta fold hydrolase [Chloroflexi bacterium]|nr:alpha/beta fold hydrolase [Chloroflexota bacterium]